MREIAGKLSTKAIISQAIVKIQVILPTAGVGSRFKSNVPKPLVELCGKPICVHALEAFEQSSEIDSIVVVGHKEKLSALSQIVAQYNLKKVAKVIAGGETRCASVANGLKEMDGDTDVVLVHDGARPLVSQKIISDVVSSCQSEEAVVAAVPVKSTIKRVDCQTLTVEETLNRECLWEIQTPQAFKKDVLIQAHAENKEPNPTDDAVMVEQLGVKVKIVASDYKNIKITTQEDLKIAEAFL